MQYLTVSTVDEVASLVYHTDKIVQWQKKKTDKNDATNASNTSREVFLHKYYKTGWKQH